MKRPQFGLRLLLLVIALFAVQRARWSVEESDRQAEIDDLQVVINVAEHRGWDVSWERRRLKKLRQKFGANALDEIQVQ